MTLAEYQRETGETDEQITGKIGDCSVGGFRKWKSGERIPRLDQMKRIFDATGGKVDANDFYGLTSRETRAVS